MTGAPIYDATAEQWLKPVSMPDIIFSSRRREGEPATRCKACKRILTIAEIIERHCDECGGTDSEES